MPDERFNPWNQTKESDEAWAEMHSSKILSSLRILYKVSQTCSLGFVMIEAPKSHGLPPSLNGQTEGSQVYAVAVFHQLHCLYVQSLDLLPPKQLTHDVGESSEVPGMQFSRTGLTSWTGQ